MTRGLAGNSTWFAKPHEPSIEETQVPDARLDRQRELLAEFDDVGAIGTSDEKSVNGIPPQLEVIARPLAHRLCVVHAGKSTCGGSVIILSHVNRRGFDERSGLVTGTFFGIVSSFARLTSRRSAAASTVFRI